MLMFILFIYVIKKRRKKMPFFKYKHIFNDNLFSNLKNILETFSISSKFNQFSEFRKIRIPTSVFGVNLVFLPENLVLYFVVDILFESI